MAKLPAPPPDWFVKMNYGDLARLDARGWLNEVQRCAHLVKEAEKRVAGEPLFAEEWSGILDEELERGAIPGFIGPPVVEVVERADQATLKAIERPALILKVWLGATDAQIIEELEAALRKAREDYRSPIRKPGPPALNSTFDSTVFDRWQRRKVVHLAKLIDWRSRQPEGARPSKADFGRWLFGDFADPNKEIDTAYQEL